MIPCRLKRTGYASGLIIFFIVLMLALSDVQAQTVNPQDTLKQYTAELKKNPDNYALREKIIKLARTIKPAPAIPADAENSVKRAESAFNKAKTGADFAQAAKEYEKALLVAPWVPDYYYNCAITYEKASKPEEAMRNYELYLTAVPYTADAGAIRKRISDLEKQAQVSNSRDALKQHIADLKKNPDNYALREKIIKLVRSMTPAPAMPSDAQNYAKSAESAFNKAKTEADFTRAAKEYEKALLVAPWVPDYYYNCAVTYEKASKPEEALRNYDLYLTAAPNTGDANAIRKHIDELENQAYRAKKYEKGYDYKEKKRDELLLLNAQKSTVGAWAMSFFIGAFTPFLGSGQYFAESYGTAVCTTLIGLASYGIFLGGVVPEENASENRIKEKRKLTIAGGVIFTAVWFFDWIYAPLATMKYNEKLKEKFSSSTGSIVPLFSYVPQFSYKLSDVDHVVKLGLSMRF